MISYSKRIEAIINKQLEALTPKVVKQAADRIRSSVIKVAKIWRRDVFKWMSESPAPGMPTRRTGDLVNALHYTTERLKKNAKGGYTIAVTHGWDATVSKTSGEDYGSIIDYKTSVQGYRDRIASELEKAIDDVVEGRVWQRY